MPFLSSSIVSNSNLLMRTLQSLTPTFSVNDVSSIVNFLSTVAGGSYQASAEPVSNIVADELDQLRPNEHYGLD